MALKLEHQTVQGWYFSVALQRKHVAFLRGFVSPILPPILTPFGFQCSSAKCSNSSRGPFRLLAAGYTLRPSLLIRFPFH